MLALPARRNSLCLFCAAAIRSPQPPRLLPLTQVACRSTAKVRRPLGDRVQRDPQDRGRSGGPLIRYGGLRLDNNSNRQNEKDTRNWIRHTVDDKLKNLRAEFREPAFLSSLQLNEEQFDKDLNVVKTTTRKGRPALRGHCTVCGAGMFIFVADER